MDYHGTNLIEDPSEMAEVCEAVANQMDLHIGLSGLTVKRLPTANEFRDVINRLGSDLMKTQGPGQVRGHRSISCFRILASRWNSGGDTPNYISFFFEIGQTYWPEPDPVTCSTCNNVGRVDCCEDVDCKHCGGLFTRDCPDHLTTPPASEAK